jgi:hypothetical protein
VVEESHRTIVCLKQTSDNGDILKKIAYLNAIDSFSDNLISIVNDGRIAELEDTLNEVLE